MSERLMPQDVIERLCKLTSEVWDAVVDPCSPSDCFCGKGGFWDTPNYNPFRDYRNSGEALEWIEQVVRNAIAQHKTPQPDSAVKNEDKQ